MGEKHDNFIKKKAKKADFWKHLDPIQGFTLKTVPGIHDPRISWLLFETKNYEMRGPPVVNMKEKERQRIPLTCIYKVSGIVIGCIPYPNLRH